MANFYKDNSDLKFQFQHPLMGKIVELKEDNFKDFGKYDYAPANVEDAISTIIFAPLFPLLEYSFFKDSKFFFLYALTNCDSYFAISIVGTFALINAFRIRSQYFTGSADSLKICVNIPTHESKSGVPLYIFLSA